MILKGFFYFIFLGRGVLFKLNDFGYFDVKYIYIKNDWIVRNIFKIIINYVYKEIVSSY